MSVVVSIISVSSSNFSQALSDPFIATEHENRDEPEEDFLEKARRAYNAHDNATTIAILNTIIDTTSDVDQLIKAHSFMSDVFVRRGEYQKAAEQLERRLSLLSPIDTVGIQTTLQEVANLYKQQGDFLSMLHTLLRAYELVEEKDQVRLVEQINTLLETQFTRDELRLVVDQYPATFPGDAALVDLIQRYDRAGNNEFFTLQQLVNQLVTQFPEHEYAQLALMRLNVQRAQLLQHHHIIGVLLPLTGHLAYYAREILTGIRLAIDTNRSGASIGMVVTDIAQNDRTLIDHANQLQYNFNPIALIGPLLSKNLGHLADWSDKYETPVLSPTATKASIPQKGSFLFSTAATGKLLGNTIAQYAMLELGMTQFAILAPNDPYGTALSDVFSNAVTQMDGDILATILYEPGETNFGSYIRTIQTEDLKHDGTLLQSVKKEEKDREIYLPGFDAIFLPGDNKTVGLIATHLQYHDMNVVPLGATGWNDSDLVRYGEQAVEGGIFVDMFNLNSPEPAMQAFVRDYRLHYQTDPSEFSALAYDATRLIIHAIQHAATNGREVGAHLRALQQFSSLSGPATMTPSGTFNRRLFVLRVEHGSFVQVN